MKSAPGGPVVDYAPGATGTTLAANQPQPSDEVKRVVAQFWLKA